MIFRTAAQHSPLEGRVAASDGDPLGLRHRASHRYCKRPFGDLWRFHLYELKQPAMTRTPHARTMDDVYRYQRYIYDLTRKYYLFGRDTLLRSLDIPDGARVLEIGCGTGRNLVVAARVPTRRRCFMVSIFLLPAEDGERQGGGRQVSGERIITWG